MPADLGSYYVWDNIPEFVARVVKNGKTILSREDHCRQSLSTRRQSSLPKCSRSYSIPNGPCPRPSSRTTFNPPCSKAGSSADRARRSSSKHNLKVSYEGRPVDAETIDWGNANIRQYTFTQPPGPDNVLGTLKFDFPNKHAIYMHDTVQPELFAETVRTLSHGCIRLHDPDRLATLLLAEDRGLVSATGEEAYSPRTTAAW